MKSDTHTQKRLFLAPSNADELFEEALKSVRDWFSLWGALPDGE